MNARHVLECYVGECCVGRLYVDTDGIMSFEWRPEDNFTEAALNYKKYVDLGSDQAIKRWMNERIIEDERPDRSLWLSMAKIPPGSCKLDIFLGTSGQSINDTFWFKPA
jgi:hypothetical protein